MCGLVVFLCVIVGCRRSSCDVAQPPYWSGARWARRPAPSLPPTHSHQVKWTSQWGSGLVRMSCALSPTPSRPFLVGWTKNLNMKHSAKHPVHSHKDFNKKAEFVTFIFIPIVHSEEYKTQWQSFQKSSNHFLNKTVENGIMGGKWLLHWRSGTSIAPV